MTAPSRPRRGHGQLGAPPIKERAEIIRAFGQKLISERATNSRSRSPTPATQSSRCAPTSQAVDSLGYYAGIAHELKGETIPATPDNLHLTLREPYGVVGRIVPFNHPIMFAVARTAAALASGNAVIVKPPETSPLSATLLAEVAAEALPPGVFNIVTGVGGRSATRSSAIPTSSASPSLVRSKPAWRFSARPPKSA